MTELTWLLLHTFCCPTAQVPERPRVPRSKVAQATAASRSPPPPPGHLPPLKVYCLNLLNSTTTTGCLPGPPVIKSPKPILHNNNASVHANSPTLRTPSTRILLLLRPAFSSVFFKLRICIPLFQLSSPIKPHILPRRLTVITSYQRNASERPTTPNIAKMKVTFKVCRYCCRSQCAPQKNQMQTLFLHRIGSE